MGEGLDGRIGAVLDKLEELGIEDNTYVILVADNGYRHEELELTPGLTQPLHARKWLVWGGDPEELQNIDGVSLAGYMAGEKPDEAFLNRNLYFHYPHYRSSVPHSAIISGSSKVLHFYEFPDIPLLFDISKDPGEVSNIARQDPEKHQKLYKEMMHYFEEVGARFSSVSLLRL